MPAEPRHLYYRLLQIGQNASHEEVVQAYRRLARGTHPDAHPGEADAPERFRAITEAYEVLADPQRRAAYDSSQQATTITTRRVPVAPRPSAGSWLFGYSDSSRNPHDCLFRAGPVHIEGDGDAGRWDDRLASDADSSDSFWRIVAAMIDSRRRH